jgi:hypothetical protein
MLNIDILGYVLIAFTLLICIKIYTESETFHLKCIISDVDGKKYCVRERAKLELAADLLAKTVERMTNLVKHMNENNPEDPDVQRLVENFNPTKISETLPTSKLTAYSENKGEKIAFCLNSKRGGNKLIDLNTLTFVAIHELSHLMTESVGHKPEFWSNFKILLVNAKKINIYNPEDYKSNPKSYCGMDITDNPYFDL